MFHDIFLAKPYFAGRPVLLVIRPLIKFAAHAHSVERSLAFRLPGAAHLFIPCREEALPFSHQYLALGNRGFKGFCLKNLAHTYLKNLLTKQTDWNIIIYHLVASGQDEATYSN